MIGQVSDDNEERNGTQEKSGKFEHQSFQFHCIGMNKKIKLSGENEKQNRKNIDKAGKQIYAENDDDQEKKHTNQGTELEPDQEGSSNQYVECECSTVKNRQFEEAEEEEEQEEDEEEPVEDEIMVSFSDDDDNIPASEHNEDGDRHQDKCQKELGKKDEADNDLEVNWLPSSLLSGP